MGVLQNSTPSFSSGLVDGITVLVVSTAARETSSLPLQTEQQPHPNAHIYNVHLTKTACHYGGFRYWFYCPNSHCTRRCGVLYFANTLQCRVCLGLPYPSQNESSFERALRKVEKIRIALLWKPGIVQEIGKRPRGMHHVTYTRLLASLATATTKALNRASARLPHSNQNPETSPSVFSSFLSAPSSSSRIGNRSHPKSFSPIWTSIWLTCLDLAARYPCYR